MGCTDSAMPQNSKASRVDLVVLGWYGRGDQRTDIEHAGQRGNAGAPERSEEEDGSVY